MLMTHNVYIADTTRDPALYNEHIHTQKHRKIATSEDIRLDNTMKCTLEPIRSTSVNVDILSSNRIHCEQYELLPTVA